MRSNFLKFEGIIEFDVEKLDNKSDFSRNFQIIFSDGTLDEDDSEIIERELVRHDFNVKDERVNFEVIYNVDLDTVTIAITIHCPLMHNNQIPEEKLYKFIEMIELILKNIMVTLSHIKLKSNIYFSRKFQ